MQAILLAAGESSRFWPLNRRHKSLVRVCGKTLFEWTIESLEYVGINDIIVIQGPDRVLENEFASKYKKLNFVIQDEAKGMGNAVMQAEKLIKDKFFVINPYYFYVEEIVKKMTKKSKSSNADMVLLGKETNRPWEHGMLGLDGDKATNLIEKPEKGKEPSKIKVAGIYLLNKKFFEFYRSVKEHQYAYEDALLIAIKSSDVRVEITTQDTPSIKYPWDLLETTKFMLKRKSNAKSKSAKIGKNVVIENSYIGKNVKIFENAVIKNSYIGDNSIVGNHSLIRDSSLGDNCLIGAHCEIARSLFQDDVHTHSGFIGDSIISKSSRIGAGIVTANVKLNRSEIKSVIKGEKMNTLITSFGFAVGENTHLGIHVSTMPGILVGSNSVIGPNTIVNENIDDNTVYYSEFNKVVKKNDKGNTV